jgi:TonB family protein
MVLCCLITSLYAGGVLATNMSGVGTVLPGPIAIGLQQDGPAEEAAEGAPSSEPATVPEYSPAPLAEAPHAPPEPPPPKEPETPVDAVPQPVPAPASTEVADLAPHHEPDAPEARAEASRMERRPEPPEVRPAPVPSEKKETTPRRKSEGASTAGARKSAHSSAGGGGSTATAGYGAHVRAILQARAKAIGFTNATASVGLSLTIGPSGSVSAVAIIASSGDLTIDKAIRSIATGASFPPPPGGSFSGAVTIRLR